MPSTSPMYPSNAFVISRLCNAGGGKKIYSCNEGNSLNWDESIKKSMSYFKENKCDVPPPHHYPTHASPPLFPLRYAARYVGSMVSDVHRTILYGGCFIYPADKKSPNGMASFHLAFPCLC